LGLGILGWSPREFWAATPFELLAALDGYADANGVRKETERFTYEDLERLMEQYPDDASSEEGIARG
jgi:hypothetical protein